jgi:hypothetical protein
MGQYGEGWCRVTTATIPAEFIARLRGDGCTTKFLTERLGVSRKEVNDLMKQAGAYRASNGQWRLAGKDVTYGRGRECSA